MWKLLLAGVAVYFLTRKKDEVVVIPRMTIENFVPYQSPWSGNWITSPEQQATDHPSNFPACIKDATGRNTNAPCREEAI